MIRLLVLVAAGLVTATATYGWFGQQLRMLPDFDLYTQGGLGLYPSPLGRAIGALGPDVFAFVSIASTAACVFAVAAMSRTPALAAWLVVASPAALYLAYAGIDSIGLALLLLGLSAELRSSSGARRSSGPRSGVGARWVAAAALAHLSLVPFALVELLRRSTPAARLAALGVAIPAALALAMTPYAPVLWLWMQWDSLPAAALGAAAGLALSFPALLVVRPPRYWLFAMFVGVVECALQVHLQARYFLPAALIACMGAPRPWTAAVGRHVRAAVETRRMPRNAREPLSTAPSALHTDAIQARRASST